MSNPSLEYDGESAVRLQSAFVQHHDLFLQKGDALRSQIQQLEEIWKGRGATAFVSECADWKSLYDRACQSFADLTQRLAAGVDELSVNQ